MQSPTQTLKGTHITVPVRRWATLWTRLRAWLVAPGVRAALVATLALRLANGALMAAVCYFLNGSYVHIVPQLDANGRPDGTYTGPTRGSAPSEFVLNIWQRWDANHYLSIAGHGYTDSLSTAFLPLYPALIRAVSVVFAGNLVAAALTISTVATVATLVLLYRLALRLSGSESVARWTLAVAALLPIAFFLIAPYTESLYLALSLAAITALLDRRWGWAAAYAALSSLTRQQGVLLCLLAAPALGAALRDVWRARGTQRLLNLARMRALWRSAAGPLLLVVAALGPYLLWLTYLRFGLRAHTPYELLTSANGWNQRLTFPLLALVSDVHYLTLGTNLVYDHALLLDVIAALLGALGLVALRRRLPLAVLLYLVAGWCAALIKVEANGVTMSASRYLLVLLPLCLVPGTLLARAPALLRLAYAGFCMLLASIFVAEWVVWLWVS